jgi:hypothetical protein
MISYDWLLMIPDCHSYLSNAIHDDPTMSWALLFIMGWSILVLTVAIKDPNF